MNYTLLSAGTATGLSKSTIYRAVKSGKLTAKKNEDGEYEIEAAELFRVFEPVQEDAAKYDVTRSVALHETDKNAVTRNMEWLKQLTDEHSKQLEEANARTFQALADKDAALKERDEFWKGQLETVKLLAAPQKKKFLGIF